MMRSIDELSIGDVVLLPLYGEVKVKRYFFDPAHNRQFITLIVQLNDRELKLICTRNMFFDYVRFEIG